MSSSPSRDHEPSITAGLERQIKRLEHQLATSRRNWANAAASALTVLPGASRSDHPAYALWLRVEMSKQDPVDVVLSSAKPNADAIPGIPNPSSSTREGREP